MVIIAVLGVLSIIMILNIQLSSDTLYNVKYLESLKARESAYYLSVSAVRDCITLLQQEKSVDLTKKDGTDSLNDLWNRPIPLITVDDFTINIEIEDLERYFAVNSIVNDGKIDETHLGQLKRLLASKEIDENLANSIADWVDYDETITEPGGSETPKKGLKKIKNAPLDSIEEIYNIEGINGEILPRKWIGKRSDSEKNEQILCDTNAGKVNINTADIDVLMSLDERITEVIANEIKKQRDSKPFEQLRDLDSVPGLEKESGITEKISNLADVKSKYFKIKIEVNKAEEKNIMTCILTREGSTVNVVSWKAE